jgi:hypothetical protein
MAVIERSKVPGIFLILMVGALLNLGLAKAFHDSSDNWTSRVMAAVFMGVAYVYWADKLPKRKA